MSVYNIEYTDLNERAKKRLRNIFGDDISKYPTIVLNPNGKSNEEQININNDLDITNEFEEEYRKNKNLDILIDSVINYIGIPKHLNCYRIYRISIKYFIENNINMYDCKFTGKNGVYNDITKLIPNSTYSSIERNLKRTQSWIYKNGDPRFMIKLFGNSFKIDTEPTTRHLMCAVYSFVKKIIDGGDSNA